MKKEEKNFEEALAGKNIPILTLDNTWHRLFTQTEPTPTIKALEEELNGLLKEQGKINSDSKDIKALKKRLMDEIVETMDKVSSSSMDKKTEKKLSDNKRLIEECNSKLDKLQDDSLDLPKRIQEVNKELMLETMSICYAQIQENSIEIEAISNWINEIRVELKTKIAIKQQMTERNQSFYNYMHNIFGSEVIDIFDMKYHVEPQKKPDTVEEKTTESKK